MKLKSCVAILCASVFAFASMTRAEDPKGTTIELAKGKIVLQMPKDWKKEVPKSNIVQYEFSAPFVSEKDVDGDKGRDAKKGEKTELARITIMGAGGGVEANLERWYGQFDDAAKAKKEANLEEFDAAGHKVHFVSIMGTFKDTMGGGPFSGAKAVLRENYSMLGAIIVTKDLEQYFIKVTGPSATVENLTDGFKKMLKEMESK
jgi:hypothetical protein